MKQLDHCECYKQELSTTNLWRIKVKHSENLSMINLSNAVYCPSVSRLRVCSLLSQH